MATKKDSAFLQRKAEVLQSLGIEATPIKEMTVVDFDYNKNQLKAAAEAKGLTEDQFMKDVDSLAEGDESATAPGMPSNTKEVTDSQRDPSVQVNKEEPKESKPITEKKEEVKPNTNQTKK